MYNEVYAHISFLYVAAAISEPTYRVKAMRFSHKRKRGESFQVDYRCIKDGKSENENNSLDVVAVRLVKEAPVYSTKPICTPMDAVLAVGDKLCEYDRECVAVICLKANGTPICCSFCSMGSLDASIVHPREILKSAILANASRIIMVHNHPGGSLTPSRDDTKITDRMIQLCELIGMPLLDHIIVAGNNKEYFSFREKDILKRPEVEFETNYRDIYFPDKYEKVAENGTEVRNRRHR